MKVWIIVSLIIVIYLISYILGFNIFQLSIKKLIAPSQLELFHHLVLNGLVGGIVIIIVLLMKKRK